MPTLFPLPSAATRRLAGRAVRLALLLVAVVSLQAAAQGTRTPGATVPLGSVLKADSTLSLPPGFQGSLDARGWYLHTGADGQPRFTPASLAEGDENWDNRFGHPGVLYGPVYALAFAPNGDLYVGGSFHEAGGRAASHVARWDGRTWTTLGSGLDGPVHAIATDGMNVYVGGAFQKAGAVLVNGIARWDGMSWSALSSGLMDSYGRGTAYALALHGGDLYVGGEFEKAGAVQARGLAKWSGGQWSEVGGGVIEQVYSADSYSVGTVYALLVRGGDLYVGGNFRFAGTVQVASVARFTPATGTWSPLGDGLVASEFSNGVVRALAFDGNTLYAGGQFRLSGVVAVNGVARWDGTSWSALGDGLAGRYGDPDVRALAVTAEGVYAGGDFHYAGGLEANFIARWSGGAWSTVTSGGVNGVDDVVYTMAVSPAGQLFVGGYFDVAGDLHVNDVAAWDAAAGAWRALGQGVHRGTCCGSVNAIAIAPNGDVFAGGAFEFAGSTAANSIARWDGQKWNPLGEGTTDGTVNAILVNGDDVYVGGSFKSIGGRSANHIAKWNRTTNTWSALGSGTNGPVNALAMSGNTLYVGGDFSAAGTVDAEDVAKWDGTNWSKLGNGVDFSSGSVYALVASGPYVVLGGDFSRLTLVGDVLEHTVNGLVLWDGSEDRWYTLGEGVQKRGSASDYSGTVYALALAGNDLYVGGDFDKAGTVAANRIARFNTADWTWSPLGSSMGDNYQYVYALVATADAIYAGGNFRTAGDVTVNGLARWDGANWTPLSTGLVYEDYSYRGAKALAANGQYLYVGGSFTGAGDKPSFNFARWTLDGSVDPVAEAQITVDPLTVRFGEVNVGQSEVLMVTISNAAGATGTLTGTVGTPTGPFAVVEGGGAFNLAPGASRQVIVQFSPVTAGSASGTLAITHNAANVGGPVNVALEGTGVSKGGMIALRNFDPNGGQQIVYAEQVAPIDTGFVFGTNIFGDRAKSVRLTMPPGKVQAGGDVKEVKVWFGYKRAGLTDQTYTIHVYAADASGSPEGAPLYSQTYRMADIVGDADPATPVEPTVHVLDRPVRVGSVFAVAIDFGTYAAADAGSVSIVTNDRIGARVADVWEQWPDGSWHNVSDAWSGTYQGGQPVVGSGTVGWQMWVEAAVETSATVGTEDAAEVPATVMLHQNHPNPFNPATTITYALPAAAPVLLTVYDVTGREVATLVDAFQQAGTHTISFDAGQLPSGAYFYRLVTGSQVLTRQMMLVK